MRLFAAARVRANGLVAACLVLAFACALTACTSGSPTAARHASGSSLGVTPGRAGASAAPNSDQPTTEHPTSAAASKNSRKTVPPPIPGNIHQTIPPRKVLTRHAVSLHSVAHFNSTVAARLTSIRSIRATAHGPGEISGPALELSVRIINSGKKPIDLSDVVVNLTDAKGDPGLTIAGAPADPFRGSLAAGRAANGRYVFTVAASDRTRISVTVTYVATQPVVLFVGNAS